MKGPVCTCPVGAGGKRVHSISCVIHGLGTRERIATRKRNQGSKKPLPAKSEKQIDRDAFLDGVKYERIRAMTLTFGECFCELSRLEIDTGDGQGLQRVEADGCRGKSLTQDQAIGLLVLHHIQKRAQGPRYERNRGPGIDDPENLVLVCDACHRRIEGR